MDELSGILNLLGRLWLREVDLATLQAIATEPFASTYRDLGGFVPTDLNDVEVENLAVEYCELLIGPKGQISPVQSVWADNQFQSATASSMRHFFDLVPGYKSPGSLPDHIGVQLDFASTIVSQPESAKVEVVKHFQQEHLNWTAEFLDRVEARTRSKFYRGLAVVTKGLISELSHV